MILNSEKNKAEQILYPKTPIVLFLSLLTVSILKIISMKDLWDNAFAYCAYPVCTYSLVVFMESFQTFSDGNSGNSSPDP